MTWRGVWAAGTSYAPRDAVSFNGSTWIATSNNFSSQPTASNPVWQLVAAHGDKGDPGGVTGLQYLSQTFADLVTCGTTCATSRVVSCPAGTRVLGGGYVLNPATASGVTITASWPEDGTVSGTHFSRWSVLAIISGTGAHTITVYAVCATAS